jgi:hypothetical protein
MEPGRKFFQIGRQRKADVFFFDFDLFQIGEAFGAEVGDEFFYEMFRSGSAGGDSDGINPS